MESNGTAGGRSGTVSELEARAGTLSDRQRSVETPATTILAVDPGNTESAWIAYDIAGGKPYEWAIEPNDVVLAKLGSYPRPMALAIEMVASYGMAVGADVFETCVWIGRFMERWIITDTALHFPLLVYRREVKLHICNSMRANDSNVRQAIIDRYGPGKEIAVGKKANPGPLYGIKADCWQALGVAITAAETKLLAAV